MNQKEARRRYGARADRLAAMLLEGDPLADQAAVDLRGVPRPAREELLAAALDQRRPRPDTPASLRALLDSVQAQPFWADVARADRGGAVFLRSGPLGGVVLGCYSLVGAYCSPAGNKPLVLSGRLTEDAPRRLAETGRFVQTVCQPGALAPHGAGSRAAVRVRLMHAAVRQMLRVDPRWREDAYGVPINQADMAITALLFSQAVAQGLRKLGVGVTRAEHEDLLHLWRLAGWMMGVREELLCATIDEAEALLDLTALTQGPPDDDSRALTQALLVSGETAARTAEERQRARRLRPLGSVLVRALLGPEYAASLRLPPDPPAWRWVVPGLRLLVRRADRVARRVPGGAALQERLGQQYWELSMARGLAGLTATFSLPEGLGSEAERAAAPR